MSTAIVRITQRRDGTIRVERIGALRDGYVDMPDAIMWRDPETGHERQAVVGDEGCIITTSSERGGPEMRTISLYADRDGVPGNGNHAIKRLHGWRGTDCGTIVTARGWARVMAITPRARGIGDVMIIAPTEIR